jgi:hypothetical protein
VRFPPSITVKCIHDIPFVLDGFGVDHPGIAIIFGRVSELELLVHEIHEELEKFESILLPVATE